MPFSDTFSDIFDGDVTVMAAQTSTQAFLAAVQALAAQSTKKGKREQADPTKALRSTE